MYINICSFDALSIVVLRVVLISSVCCHVSFMYVLIRAAFFCVANECVCVGCVLSIVCACCGIIVCWFF